MNVETKRRLPLLKMVAFLVAISAVSARADDTYNLLVPPQMPAGDSSDAVAINNFGQIIISTWNPSTYASDGYYVYNLYTNEYSVLPSDPDAISGNSTIFNGLNNLGEYVGLEPSAVRLIPTWASNLGYEAYNAFTYSSGKATFTNFMPTTPGAFVSEAFGINDKGDIVGVNNTGSGDQGWIMHGSTFTTLDVFPSGPNVETGIPSGPTTDPQAINNRGDIVGYYSNPDGNISSGAFAYDGVTHQVAILDTGTSISQAFGINDESQIVGFMTNDPTQSTGNGFVLTEANLITLGYPGASYTQANGINNLGQVVGQYYDDSGISHAFLVTPRLPDTSGTGPTSRLSNISARSFVGTGGTIVIAGLHIGGAPGVSKDVLVRGIGPALSQFGLTGLLATPTLAVYDSSGALIASNTGWGTKPTTGTSTVNVSVRAATAADMGQVGAFSLAGGTADSALVVSLPSGSYTAELSGANATTGTALLELYEMNTTDSETLTNISARASVGPGGNIPIAGFVITGTQWATVIVRGIGPTLGTSFGVSGSLAQPVVSVFDGNSVLIASDTGWGNAPVKGTSSVNASLRQATVTDMSRVGAFSLAAGSGDSAMVLVLPPGVYSAEISGVGGTTGVALAEVYVIQP